MRNFVLVCSILAAGCTGSAVNQAASNADRFSDLICEDCYAVVGAASTEECRTTTDSMALSDSEIACLNDLIGRDDAARNFYECFVDLEEEFLSCLDEANNGCNMDELGACTSSFSDDIDTCTGMLTADAAQSIQECTD